MAVEQTRLPPDAIVATVVNRRPRLELRGSSATPEEAAAVMAAVEQFLRDTVPPPAGEAPEPSGWIRAARLEAVDREPLR